jgi:hypothetical protein
MKKIMKYKFEKEENGNWYVVLPEWTGEKAELQMVMGADTMLDKLANGEKEVELKISLEPFDNALHLRLLKEGQILGGGDYILEKYNGEDINLDVWLCEVTRFVFGFIPDNIYLEKV